MTTSFVKPTLRILLGLMLIFSLLCVSAFGQSRGRKRHRRGKRAATRAMTPPGAPTNDGEYSCDPEGRVVLSFDYTGTTPNNGFLGNQYTTIERINGRPGRTTRKAVQWSTYQVTQTPGGTTWSFQAQDGSFVCDPRQGGSVFIPDGKGEVRFTGCRNYPNRVCSQ